MKKHCYIWIIVAIVAALSFRADQGFCQDAAQTNTVTPLTPTNSVPAKEQLWNIHMQATYVGDWHPSFPAKYTGPESLDNHSATDETVSYDLFLGLRLWQGAEFHVDGLFWQGFGFNRTLGVEAFPSAEAYKIGSPAGNICASRVFIRQTIGLGGEEESVENDSLHLAGERDVSRLTLTVGQISVQDVFDQNQYAGDAANQFLNWAMVGNEAWDYPANSLGFITGFAAELNEPNWAARYGFFQIPRVQNGMAEDPAFLRAWGMVTELERRIKLNDHSGAVRFLAYLNRADMGSYAEANDDATRPANILDTRDYRLKYGFGINADYELFKGVGAFTRLGWSDGQTENWSYADVNKSASAGFSIKGDFWHRPDDTVGLAGVVNGISRVQQQFFENGGLGILAGDGALNYGLEQTLETYYRLNIWKNISATADYQYVTNPAYNKDRGPVSIASIRMHWEF